MKTQTTRTSMKRAMSLLATFAMAAGTLAALPPVSATAAEVYRGLEIAGVSVTDENCSDILGNGVFSYDPNTKTLNINGDYTDTQNYAYADIISCFGNDFTNSTPLTINVVKDSSLSGGEGIRISGSAIITGSGKLQLNTRMRGISVSGFLTLKDADVTINSQMDGFSGTCRVIENENDHDSYARYLESGFQPSDLTVDHSYLKVNASDDAFYRMRSIDLIDAELVTPTEMSCYDATNSGGDFDGGYEYIWWRQWYDFEENVDAEEVVPIRLIEIIPNNTDYNLTVAGSKVNERNCSDILGNGVFSYDPASNTLNVKGSYTCSDPVIESHNAGMTIQVTADSELTSTDNEALSLYKDNTIICKKRVSSGVRYKLTLSGKLEGIVQNNCPLTIQDARLEVHGSRFGIIGQTNKKFEQNSRLNHNSLSINNSSVSITSGSGAILGMKQGITQTNTAIYPVQRVLFSNQCFGITDRYGKNLKNLTMVSKEDSVRIIRVSGDAAVVCGKDAQFSVAAAGYDLSYQWQYKNPITKRWVNLDKSQATGIRTNTLTLAGIAENDGMQVRCLVGTTLFTDYSIPSSSMSLMVRTRFSERPKDFFDEIRSRSYP